jgi:hypothetical protein
MADEFRAENTLQIQQAFANSRGDVPISFAIELVELLGSGEKLRWSRDADGLKVSLPSQRPSGAAFVLKVTRG